MASYRPKIKIDSAGNTKDLPLDAETLKGKNIDYFAVNGNAQPCNGQIKPEHGNEMNYYGSNTPYGWLNWRGGVNEMRIGTGANNTENEFGTLKAGTIYSNNKEVEIKENVNKELAKKMNNGEIQAYRYNEIRINYDGPIQGSNKAMFFNYNNPSNEIEEYKFCKGTPINEMANIGCNKLNCSTVVANHKLLFENNEAVISLKNSQAEYPMLTFKASTTEPYGCGVLIGGGGSVVIGAGESANTVFNAAVSNPGDESLRLSADEAITFYPGQQNGYSDKGTYINPNGDYMMHNKKVATEEQVNGVEQWARNNLQFKLSSGNNIKTINGASILGSGDLKVTIDSVVTISNFLFGEFTQYSTDWGCIEFKFDFPYVSSYNVLRMEFHSVSFYDSARITLSYKTQFGTTPLVLITGKEYSATIPPIITAVRETGCDISYNKYAYANVLVIGVLKK